jgi:hypothetical protein
VDRCAVKKILHYWGTWGNCRYGVEYPRFSLSIPVTQDCYIAEGKKCTDAQGMILDTMVSRLYSVNKEYHSLIIAHFVYKRTQDQIADFLDIPRRTVRDKLDEAVFVMMGMIIHDPKIYATLSFLLF